MMKRRKTTVLVDTYIWNFSIANHLLPNQFCSDNFISKIRYRKFDNRWPTAMQYSLEHCGMYTYRMNSKKKSQAENTQMSNEGYPEMLARKSFFLVYFRVKVCTNHISHLPFFKLIWNSRKIIIGSHFRMNYSTSRSSSAPNLFVYVYQLSFWFYWQF